MERPPRDHAAFVWNTDDQAVTAGHSVDGVEPGRWRQTFDRVMGRVGGQFGRAEPRRTAGQYVAGLLSGTERKNCWWLAEHAGHARPDAMQRLLRTASWNVERVRDELRAIVVERLADPDGVLIADETGFLKKGVHSVGVQRQYTGTAGRIENAQVGVFLSYASRHGRALIDRRLYLPEKTWCADRDRCAAAGVPAEVGFATKPKLAAEMLAAALDAGVPASWVTADEVYGANTTFRAGLRARNLGYVLAVACDQPVVTGAGRARVDTLAAELPPRAWQRRSAGCGSKGPRDYDWAWVSINPDKPWDDADRWLLSRRHRRTGELAFYLCWAPTPVPLQRLVRVAGTRWAVEESFQAAKGQAGLDHYQVRSWTGWHRHTVLAMLALAVLTVLVADARDTAPRPRDRRGQELLELTTSEIRHLINFLIIKPAQRLTHYLSWSTWRRRHQARARRLHYRRRTHAG
jgi:SRSO17 transposase